MVDSKLLQPVRELQNSGIQGNGKLQQLVREMGDEEIHQPGGENVVPLPVLFTLVPWGHHINLNDNLNLNLNYGWSKKF